MINFVMATRLVEPFNILTAAGNAIDLLSWFLSVYGVEIGP